MLIAQTHTNLMIRVAHAALSTRQTGNTHRDVQDNATTREMPDVTVVAPRWHVDLAQTSYRT
jgi:transketolase C-terminal domain/subunit